MRVVDSLRLSYFIFRRNKLRTGLTVLGVSVGIGVIVFLISLGYGLERIALARITGSDSLQSMDVSAADAEHPLNDAAISTIASVDAVQKVDPIIELPAQIETGAELIDLAGIWGVDSHFFDLEGLAFQTGQTFHNETEIVISTGVSDLLKVKPADVLTKKLDLKVFPQNDDSGQGVSLRLLRVSGVVAQEAPLIYITHGLLTSYSDGTYHLIKVKALNEQSVPAVKQAILDRGFQVQATLDDVGQLTRGFGIARAVFGAFGLIAVIVSSIGMLNTMTISLLERIKEIGIMKAIGATDRDIWVLFLTEAGLIGAFGGLGGVLIGKMTAYLFNGLFNVISQRAGGPSVDLFDTPFTFVVAMLLFGAAVGIATGMYPARRGATLNPLQALRYE